MKILTENAIYVQKNDMTYLSRMAKSIPSSILIQVYGKGAETIDDENKNEFIKFDKDNEIEFFKNLDWIVDYQVLKNLTDEEIYSMGQDILNEKNRIARQFNLLSPVERKKNISMVNECELLDYKLYSIRDILWFNQGHIYIKLPKGIDYPESFAHKNVIQRALKRVFYKN